MKNIHSNNLLFIKLETAPELSKYEYLDLERRKYWDKKVQYQQQFEDPAQSYNRNAGLWAEFGKIISITTGSLSITNNKKQLFINTFKGLEYQILNDFKAYIIKNYNKTYHLLCAHNGKCFTFPFIGRRYIINNIAIPEKLSFYGKKPWEIPHIDTMELWKFGDFKYSISLALLANILGIPKIKKDRSQVNLVNELDYQYAEISQISKSCEQDLLTLVNVFLRLRNEEVLTSKQVRLL